VIEAAYIISVPDKLARSTGCCAGKMSRGEIIKAGYLTKSPPEKSGRVAQWHKRWFVLADSRLVYPVAPRYVRLEYYQNEEEAKRLADPKGEWTLRVFCQIYVCGEQGGAWEYLVPNV